MKRVHLQAVAVVVPLMALLVATYLLFTDPSDSSYECPGTTWTLLQDPAPAGPANTAEFFDAGKACNGAARAQVRAASMVMLAALSIAVLTAAPSVAVARRPMSR